MDEETRGILAVDRARLTQTTALGTFTLSQELGLSEEATKELQNKLIDRLKNMSPAYHNYVNQLLGSAATSFMNQLGSVRPYMAAEQAIASNGHHAPEAELIPLHASEPEPETAVIAVEETVPEPVAPELLDYDPDDLLELPEDVRLFDQPKMHRNMKKFLQDTFMQHHEEIAELSPRAASLLAYQVIDTYMNTKIPQASPDRKARHRERIEQYIGLYAPPLGSAELTERLSITTASFYMGMSRATASVSEVLDAELVFRRATTTAEYGDIENIFTSEIVEKNESIVISETPETTTVTNGFNKTIGLSEVSREVESEHEVKEFFEHFRVPASMRNFLLGVFPKSHGDRILALEQWPISLLTYQLIEEYRGLVAPGLTEDTKERRCKWVEQWAGLYTSPQDEESIARRSVTNTQSVRANLDAVIKTLETKIPHDQLKEMYELANRSVRPGRVARPAYSH